ncbi:hypothetical protein OD917_19845 [Flavobacterium sp. SH_e]|uniref:hypothetical protein n=1 Tax=Flavobacterium sp. SH_e TaxID=2983767 RepID=UPI0021E4F499|nr:hypothetical protein [Flavobacterium sp. SH_e]MCV2487196.1 hypothetical protein [Flavobacterium sp. SH_e]
MTIQEYFSKIEALQNNKNTFSANADLKLYIQKIQQNCIESSFMINSLFQESTVNNTIIAKFSDHLKLLFLDEQESGNVCFANSDEIRSEYRQSFKLIDLLDYIYAFGHSSFYHKSQKIIITNETEVFWKLVKIGSTFRNEIK